MRHTIGLLLCGVMICFGAACTQKTALDNKKGNAMDPRTSHPQETLIETFDHNGVAIEVVEWAETIWCGKVEYAANNTDEPNVEKALNDFFAIHGKEPVNERLEKNWDVCISINYRSSEHPSGVMFGFLVGTDQQADGYDIYKVPAQRFMRISLGGETARALGREPWKGGIPPYEWIGEIASNYGYTYADGTQPIYEYYGFYNPNTKAHEFGYLYVPVVKK